MREINPTGAKHKKYEKSNGANRISIGETFAEIWLLEVAKKKPESSL